MRIGLDIDNVISDFDRTIYEEFLKEDKKKRNRGIVHPDGRWIKYLFDWTKEESEAFFHEHMQEIAKRLEVRTDAKKYMDKLLERGHSLYLISHRAYPDYIDPFLVTKDWLKKNDIYYTDLVLTKSTDKSDECKELDIDVMFDDVVSNCKCLIASGIKCYLMETEYNVKEKSEIDSVRDWKDLYETILSLEKDYDKKIHVILDTDTNNEADDQFALSYLLKSKDKVILDAVTIAPYSHMEDSLIVSTTEKSYKVCQEVFSLLGEDSTNMIFRGATDYFCNGYEKENEAISRMVEVINQNDFTYLLAIGAITNVAVLLKLYPNLASKIKVIWLGGHSLMDTSNYEFNFKQDVEAVRYVLNTNVDLTIIPCNGVASNLTTSIYELSENLNVKEGIGKYLYDGFYNDGYHGLTKRRVIWDIAVIAYVLHPEWFKIRKVNTPIIDCNLKYDFCGKGKVNFAISLDQNAIYEDLFSKLKS